MAMSGNGACWCGGSVSDHAFGFAARLNEIEIAPPPPGDLNLQEIEMMQGLCENCGDPKHTDMNDVMLCRDQLIFRERQMNGQETKEGGKKFDTNKPRWELLPYDAVRGVVDVLTDGAKKYSDRNWELGIAYGRVFGALQRHLTAWWQGENNDPESGRSHLDHAACELMFLSAYEKRGMIGFDDRPGSLTQGNAIREPQHIMVKNSALYENIRPIKG
jgi:hypothetical protein